MNTSTALAPTSAKLRLYAWQHDAMGDWRAAGRRGIVEAVTGTGKTRLGVAAIHEAQTHGLPSVVLVPSLALQAQWVAQMRDLLPDLTVGRWGDGGSDRLGDCDAVIAVINSAVKHLPQLRTAGLIVADECHRYGSRKHRKALAAVPCRLGLTATLERADEGVDRALLPYFGAVVHRIGYERALADGIVAPFTVDLIGVDFADTRGREQYDRLTAQMDQAREALVAGYGYPSSPGAFLERAMSGGADWQSREGQLCSQYAKAFTARRQLLASDPAKTAALARLAPDIRASGRCLVFTETIEAAEACTAALAGAGVRAAVLHSKLRPRQRQHLLRLSADGHLHALIAPRLLDEGVDLPDADLGIIVAASKSKRQMIQRMGRILRRKSDGRAARFVVLHITGTGEDPATGAHAAFMDELLPHAERIGGRAP